MFPAFFTIFFELQLLFEFFLVAFRVIVHRLARIALELDEIFL
jgi:hypothetical protein